MSDEHDDATGSTPGNADGDARAARPSGKRSGRSRSRATLAETGEGPAASAGATTAGEGAKRGLNPFAAIWLYIRQVVAELRKVIWPTRNQMVTYSIVVTAFVVLVTAFVSGLDLGFAKLMLWAFG